MKTKTVAHDRIETILGIGLDPDEVIDLAERSGLKAEKEENEDGNLVYEVTIPPYRVDVLHPLDVIDDLGRAYGFNELEPRYPDGEPSAGVTSAPGSRTPPEPSWSGWASRTC